LRPKKKTIILTNIFFQKQMIKSSNSYGTKFSLTIINNLFSAENSKLAD